MKAALFFLGLLATCALSAQVFQDDFSDGDFSADPAWSGSDALFAINGDGQLQLQDSEAGQATLFTAYTEVSLENREWRVYVRQSFSGSDNNNGRIYLTALTVPTAADGNDAAGAQGYFLRLGEAGSDDAIHLYRDDNTGDSPVLIASGTPGLVSSSFELALRILRDDAGNWQVWADASGGTEYVLEGSGTDATYTTTVATGVLCTYTSSNADNFFYDDWFFGDEEVDETAPGILSAAALSANELSVVWSEPVTAETGTNTVNYGWSGNTPSSAVAETPDQVTLTFDSSFPSGVEQTLSVSGVQDAAGNTMTPQDLPFTWVEPVVAGVRDVVIHEIMADPDPPIGLPGAEYVELFNATAGAINLQDWVFVNTNTEKVLPAAVLPAAETVILCDEGDLDAFVPYGQVIGIPSFSALSNAGDSLSLRDNLGTVVDVVVYTDDWYNNSAVADGGTSLEQVNPFRTCSGAFNWTASQSLSGGSPGQQNSVFNDLPDTQAPFLETVLPQEPNSIAITFNEPLDPAVWDALVITVEPGLTAVLVSSDATSAVLETDLPFTLGETYTLSITGAADCEGNAAGTLTQSFTLGFTPEPGDLRITEILADPDEELLSPNAEFVEIENRSAVLLDISSVHLEDGTFSGQVLLSPGERLVLCDVDEFDAFIAFPAALPMEDFPGLTNSGRTLTLQEDTQVFDQVTYTDDWYGDPTKDDGGYSLELINPNDPCSDGTNWRASDDPSGATPGLLNSVWDETPDTQAPQVQWLVFNTDTQLGVLLDEQPGAGLGDPDITFTTLAGDPAPFGVASFAVDPEAPELLLINLDAPVPAGVRYVLEGTGLQDCWGNASTVFAFPFERPEPALAGDLLINEILFNPTSDGADFVELINASDHFISLADMGIAEEDAGAVASIKPITPWGILLGPGEYVAVSTSIAAQTSEYPFTRADRFLELESMPGYNNGAGVVVAVDALQQVLDRVPYTEDQHFALLDDVDGVSLERISTLRASDDDTNWHSAAESQGFATPGYLNSQSVAGASVGGGFTTDLDVFSPDNDGFEDVVQISYVLDRPGWVATVRIFDQQGREVRLLRQQELLGTSGTFSWDGIRDDRQKARMGMYVMLVERFLPSGEVATDKLTVALAHKLR
ncbi:MAG: lamin tail domain-containing protein [Flavobacteriales bacterium]